MAQMLRPHVRVEASGKDEVVVHVILDLNINLQTGEVRVAAGAEPTAPGPPAEDKWFIPEFDAGGKIAFGKKGT